ncbi:hypothetical protein [Streptomyces phaeochromogenes]
MTQTPIEDDSRGLVRLSVPGEIRATDTDPLTFADWTRTVTCPQCGTTSGLTLQANYNEAVVICPQDQRAFRDADISALKVRLLFTEPFDQETLNLLRGDRPWFDVTPVLDENRTLPDFRYLDEEDDDDPRVMWEELFGFAAEENGPPLMIAMSWARQLMSWVLPHYGRLFHHLFGAGTPSPAREAHMILVALGLALYESAFEAGPGTRMAALPLTAPMERLRPGPDAAECRQQLRAVRPLGDHMLGGRLRLTDLARLEACTEQEWDRWCEAAFRVLAVHLKAARSGRPAARRRARSTGASPPDRPHARPLHRRRHLSLVQRARPGPLASGTVPPPRPTALTERPRTRRQPRPAPLRTCTSWIKSAHTAVQVSTIDAWATRCCRSGEPLGPAIARPG